MNFASFCRAALTALLAGAVLLTYAPASPAATQAGLLSAGRTVTETPDGASSSQEEAPQYPEMTPESLRGVWAGRFPVMIGQTANVLKLVYDGVRMDFDPLRGQSLMLRIDSVGDPYAPPNDWRIQDNELYFSVNAAPWLAQVRLHLQDEWNLVGTYTQYGRDWTFSLNRVNGEPAEGLQTQFVFEGKTGEEWYNILRTYPSFSSGGSLPFTYDLYDWGPAMPLVSAYRLDKLWEQYREGPDTTLMKAVLDLVCENFRHDGAAVFPEKGMDPIAAVNYCAEYGGIECRGLAAILSEMLRLCGVPAKPVMCIPSLDPCEDCHVVVHAYSYDLGQWVMLDPTYHLMLQNEQGAFVSLPMLRDALIKGDTLVANEDAGHNGMPFSMDYYRAYMAKNTFRFSSALNHSFEARAGQDGNRLQMLAPEGWTVPYSWSRPEKVTTSADAFWAPPPPEPEAGVTPGGRNLEPESGDFIVFGGSRYMAAWGADWLEPLRLYAGDRLGEIQRTGVAGDFAEGDASLLPVGTPVYRCRTNASILLAQAGDSLVPYVRWAEG